MRILFVNDSNGTGGVTSQTHTLAGTMTSLGHDITLFYYWKYGKDTKNCFRQIYNSSQSLTQLLCTEDFNVIICDLSVMRHGFDIALKLTHCTTPVIAVCHGYATVPFAKNIKHQTVAVSEYIRDLLMETTSADVATIINGVDTNIFRPDGPYEASSEPIALWVGRSDDPCKDFAGLMSVAPYLSDQGYKIWIIDGAADKRWESGKDWLGSRAEVLRNIDPGGLADIYRTTAKSGGFFISTSKEESLGIALLEAMACGCTVIAPGIGGIPEIIKDGIDGYLYNRNNAISAIQNIVSAKTPNPNIAANAISKVSSEMNADIMTERYLGLCELLTSERQPPKPASVFYKRLLCFLLKTRRSLNRRNSNG